MGLSGLESGLVNGIRQGVKTGRGMSNMLVGKHSGISNGILNKNKMQDPEVWTGINAPIVHWNSENCTTNSSGNLLTITNLSNRSNPSSLSIGSDPNKSNDVVNNKASLTFDATDYVSGGSLTGNDASIMLVFNLNTTSTSDLCTYIFTTISDTIGDIYIQSVGGNAIQTTLIGNPTTNKSIYQTPSNLIQGRWYILTAKFRLYQANGIGSEQELYINGTKQNIVPITTSYTGLTTDTFQTTSFFFGGNSSQTRGGNKISTALTFDYWINESEQIRLENYFKWYYGYNF